MTQKCKTVAEHLSEKLLPLHLLMRKSAINMVSFVLTLWYVFSIVGFSSHVCASTGESFFLSLLEDTTCAGIHPHHNCSQSSTSCCMDGREADGCGITMNCCSNSLHSITVTGERTGNEEKISFKVPQADFFFASVPAPFHLCSPECRCFMDDAGNVPSVLPGGKCGLNLLYCIILS